MRLLTWDFSRSFMTTRLHLFLAIEHLAGFAHGESGARIIGPSTGKFLAGPQSADWNRGSLLHREPHNPDLHLQLWQWF